MAFVRSSKFRHIYGEPSKTDLSFNGLKIDGSGDTNCAVNGQYLAVVKSTKIFILPLKKTGRIEENQLNFIDCTTKILDVQWSPFDDDILLAGGETGEIHVWQIPKDGLKENMNDPFLSMTGVHHRKVTSLAWHPSADSIFAACGHDNFVSVWNAGMETLICTIEVDMAEQPFNLAWNYDGSLLAFTCKFGKGLGVTLVDPRTGEKLAQCKDAYSGMKPAKLTFLKNGDILVAGSHRSAERSAKIFRRNDTALVERIEFDLGSQGSGIMNIYYDFDLYILYLFTKGDSAVKYYEINEETSQIFFLSAYTTSISQKGGIFMPKRHLDTSRTEVARFYKCAPTQIQPTAFIVPRKSDQFQRDLYPDCLSDEPALTADEWIAGENKPPKLMAFDGNNQCPSAKKERKVLLKPVKKPISDVSPAVSGGAVTEVNVVPDGINLAELVEDMKKVKATVRKLNKRVTTLEELLEKQGAGDANEEEEE